MEVAACHYHAASSDLKRNLSHDLQAQCVTVLDRWVRDGGRAASLARLLAESGPQSQRDKYNEQKPLLTLSSPSAHEPCKLSASQWDVGMAPTATDPRD